METKTITTSDIYEASYYFLNGANISRLAVVEELQKQIFKITLTGEMDNLAKLEQEYFQGLVTVNLFDFRRCYNRIINIISNAKRDVKLKEKTLKGGKL